MAVAVKDFTRQSLPRLPFRGAAEAVLPDWEISLVFAGKKRAQALNQGLRGKTYVPNVLSYKAGDRSGEIVICPVVAKDQAPAFGLSASHFILLLFIHALLHLKGERHGSTMERSERALMARFVSSSRATRTIHSPTTHGQTHRNGHRHRHVPGQAGRRRRSR